MTRINPEQLDELITHLQNGDFEFAETDTQARAFSKLISELESMPRINSKPADFSRVKDQMLNRIAESPQKTFFISWISMRIFPKALRVTAGVIGTLMILVSLTMGTAVAALQSVPGDAIYSLKKIVENVQLKMTTDENKKANLQIQFANNRLDEIQAVLQKKDDGELSDQEVKKLVSETVKDLNDTTAAVAKTKIPKLAIITKLNDLSNKLKTASIQNEGELKVELEKVIETAKISKEEAIKNMERAGLKVENKLITLVENDANKISASGKLTAVTESFISIGTAKFLLNKDTKYVNGAFADLKIDAKVDIEGEIKDNKTYALKIVVIPEIKPEVKGADTNNAQTENSGILIIPENQ